jgi:hypothetical protein
MRNLVVAFIGTVLLSPSALNAAPSNLCLKRDLAAEGSQFTVSTVAMPRDGYDPAATWNPDRNEYLVVWKFFSADDSLEYLYAQRLAADGTPIGTNFIVTSDSNAIITPTLAAANDHDEYFIAWQTQSTPFNGALGLVMSGDTSTKSTPVAISTDGFEPQTLYVPSASQFFYSGRLDGISAQYINLNGTTSGARIPLVSNAQAAPAPNGQPAKDSTGKVLVPWRNQVADTLAGRLVSNGGTILGAVTKYSSDFPGTNLAAVSDFETFDQNYILLYNLFDTQGLKWVEVSDAGTPATPQPLASDANLYFSPAGVAYNPTGKTTLLLWVQIDAANASTIMGNLVQFAGDAPVPLLSTTDELPGISIARNRAHGEVLAVWEDKITNTVQAMRIRHGCASTDEIFFGDFETTSSP